MKKIHLLGTLAFAIVAAGVMLSQTNASNVTITVDPAGGTGCSAATDLNFASVPSSYSAQTQTGVRGSAFTCTGSSASASTYTVTATNATGPQSTLTTNVRLKITSSVIAGNAACQTHTAMESAFTSVIGGAVMLSRAATGLPCTLSATPVTGAIALPANAPAGLYTGTITIDATGW